MKKVVIASDSFKGSLSSEQVAAAAQKGIRDVWPDAEVLCLSVADGGEGSMAAFKDSCLDSLEVSLTVMGPLGRHVDATYLILRDSDTAFIEIAQACGLTLIEKDERDPLKTSTYGAGQMIMDAISRGCRKVIVALGGTCTNDAAVGMLGAMGYRITNDDGAPNACNGAGLLLLCDIDDSEVSRDVRETDFIALCDVDSPLCGPKGAARVYAPQKGADQDAVAILERGLCRFAEVVLEKTGVDISDMPGAGAAGGVAGAMHALLGAQIRKGSDFILDTLGFEKALEGADLVITGEGRLDSQTLTGKLPYTVAQMASGRGIPVIAICGQSQVSEMPGACAVLPITPEGMPLYEAMKPETAMENIRSAIHDFPLLPGIKNKSQA